MTCIHRWLIESARDAAQRWEKDETPLKDRRFAASCARCGAERTYRIDEPDDDALPSLLQWMNYHEE